METPQVTAQRIRALMPAITETWGISRCDGTPEELAHYRSGSHDYGWNIPVVPRVGDLLVGCVGRGDGRVIINVNRVEGLTRKGVEWMEKSDVQILPSIGWNEVALRAAIGRAWKRLDGKEAVRFVEALTTELQEMTDVPETEGAIRKRLCRERSGKNRMRKLDEAQGVCEGCGANYRVGFGYRGDRALEVHHRVPMSTRRGLRQTGLADLAVLCASCHRLVHADPQLRIEGLRAGWNRMQLEV